MCEFSESRSVYVLFGSQTGNSECIANDINERLQGLDNLSVKTMPLNEAAGINLKEESRSVIIGLCELLILIVVSNPVLPNRNYSA